MILLKILYLKNIKKNLMKLKNNFQKKKKKLNQKVN